MDAKFDRRSSLAALAGLLAAPLAASGAEDRQRVVGYLIHGSGRPRNLAGQLRELGYVEGNNLRFELRQVPESTTPGQLDRAATELAGSGAEVLVVQGASRTAALHRATKTVPIVTYGVSNPVSLGLARSLRSPGMNVTGLSYGLDESAVLQFGVLRLLRPGLRRVVFMVPTPDPMGETYAESRKLAPEHIAAANGLELDTALVSGLRDCDRIFATIRDAAHAAAWVVNSPLLPPGKIAEAAIRRKLATHGQGPAAVKEGLLVSCGLIHSDPHRRVATIIDKILRGANPGTIPFEQPDKSSIAFNRATAAAIGVAIPEEVKIRATEVFG